MTADEAKAMGFRIMIWPGATLEPMLDAVIRSIPSHSSWIPLSRATATSVHVTPGFSELLAVCNHAENSSTRPPRAPPLAQQSKLTIDADLHLWKTSEVLELLDRLVLYPSVGRNVSVTLLSVDSSIIQRRDVALDAAALMSRFPRLHTFLYDDTGDRGISPLVDMLLDVVRSGIPQDEDHGTRRSRELRPCRFGYKRLTIKHLRLHTSTLPDLLCNTEILRGLSGAEVRFSRCTFSIVDPRGLELATLPEVAAAHNVRVDFDDCELLFDPPDEKTGGPSGEDN